MMRGSAPLMERPMSSHARLCECCTPIAALIYLAGLIDGEGNVGWRKRYDGKTALRFNIVIKMTSEVVIDWLVENFGGSKGYCPSANPRWKDQWRWRVQNTRAEELYAAVEPYLLIKNGIQKPNGPPHDEGISHCG